MDYALFALTALGAIGLYLILPRERAPLARLGGLLGAAALAGFFLVLIRAIDKGVGGHEGPPIYFYLFAAIMIAGAVGVITQPRPVYAALYFVLITLAGAGMFVLLMAEFMAIVLIIIYAGAILVTYVFVIMLASQGSTGGAVAAPIYDRRAASPMAAIFVAFVLVGGILQVLMPANGPISTSNNPDKLMMATLGVPSTMPDMTAATQVAAATQDAAAVVPTAPSDVQLVGISLYSQYSLSLELAGILLTLALVGAVVISRKNSTEHQALGTGDLPTE